MLGRRAKGWPERVEVVLAAGFLCLNFGLSLYHTMTLDFQPEFRYLLPAWCVLILPGVAKEFRWNRLGLLLISVALLLAFTSFLVAAIVSMPATRDYQIGRDARYFEPTTGPLSESEEIFYRKRGLESPAP